MRTLPLQTETRSHTLLRPRGLVRWMICALLFFATTVNYIDRQVLSVLKPMLETQLNWSEADYGWIVFAFQTAYALMMPVAGRFIDWAGTRLGYALAVLLWSFAAMSHSFARTAMQFSLARFALGIGEAANFPAAIRTVADWFPQKERSFATGIFNSGTNVGVVVAALSPFVAIRFGWQATFVITGTLGLLWVVPWLLWFRNPREHSSLSKTELAYIESDRPITGTEKGEYSTLIAQPGAWAFIIGKLVTDPVWWFFLFWIPSFLNRTYHLDLTALGLPLIIIYIAADVGSVAGGWLFASLVSHGWTPNRARKTAMLICALAATPVVSILFVQTVWPAVAIIGLAAAAHQGWSANLFTLVSDTLPRRVVASAVGLGGLAGAMSGMLISPLVGYWLDFSNGSYRPLFVVAGTAYLIAFSVIHLILPTIARTEAKV